MPRKRDFDIEIDSLPIAEKAKRVLDSFLEAQFTPSPSLPPRRAKKLRQRILCIVEHIAEIYNLGQGNTATISLYTGLMDACEIERLEGHDRIADLLADLAYAFKSVATHRRSNKTWN